MKQLFALSLLMLAACDDTGPKVWHLNAKRGGLERTQAGEFLKWSDADGYTCFSQADITLVLTLLQNQLVPPQQAAKP